MDAVKDSELVNIITAAYNNKGSLVTGSITYDNKKYNVKSFISLGKEGLSNKTIVVLIPIE